MSLRQVVYEGPVRGDLWVSSVEVRRRSYAWPGDRRLLL